MGYLWSATPARENTAHLYLKMVNLVTTQTKQHNFFDATEQEIDMETG